MIFTRAFKCLGTFTIIVSGVANQGDTTTMRRRRFALLLGLALTAVTLGSARPVRATLGETDASISKDQKALSAVRRAATAARSYKVQTLKSDANEVREYVAANGVVFAIAWNGLVHPDLASLLGSYVGEYREALRQTPGKPGQRGRRVASDRVVVEQWGHMRNMQGRAYLPALIPPGVTIDEIH
jgi:hypothetical protein